MRDRLLMSKLCKYRGIKFYPKYLQVFPDYYYRHDGSIKNCRKLAIVTNDIEGRFIYRTMNFVTVSFHNGHWCSVWIDDKKQWNHIK